VKENGRFTAIHILRRLREADLYYVSAATLAALLDVPRARAYAMLRGLADQGLVQPVEAGKYVVLGLEPERVLADPFYVATRIVYPSYVSYWSALHFHNLTEQVPRTVFVATTLRHSPVDFNGARFVYVHLMPHKFFGYQREPGDLPVLVADVEKAIVDSLDQLRYAGGLSEVAKAIAQAGDRLDLEQIVEYASRMQNRSLCSRLGYLLQLMNRPVDGLNISLSFVLLDPAAKAAGPYDHRWRVRVNASEQTLFSWRES
jgi:predicted transcriptional regulator of viral defense system